MTRPARFFFAGLTLFFGLCGTGRAQDGGIETQALLEALWQEGVSPGQVLGVDAAGVPLVCGVPRPVAAPLHGPPARAALSPGTRSWETIPGVIRNDGVEAFRLEVDVNGPLAGVVLEDLDGWLTGPPTPLALRDDGMGEDRVAGDHIYTGGPFRYASSAPAPSHYLFDPASPEGLMALAVGALTITELDGTATTFLDGPEVGILRADISEAPVVSLAPDVVATPHLINVQTDLHATSGQLRNLDGMITLTQRIYAVLPDAFDFLMLFSTNRLELLPMLRSENFVAGVHTNVQINTGGIGLEPYDFSSFYGSSGRLLGINVLDSYTRGASSYNATHELSHQWVAFVDYTLGISDGSHYDPRSSAASLVGGFAWHDNGDGTFALDCSEGRNGAHHAPPLDRYMMGLLDGDAVPPVHVYDETLPVVETCDGGTLQASDIVRTVSIEEIQLRHGVRTPGPAGAQRDFQLGFVAESHERLLTTTELTFYEILAAHYTKVLPPDDPDPYVGDNWVPVTRFFGDGTTWRSDVPMPVPDVTPPVCGPIVPEFDGPGGALSAVNTSAADPESGIASIRFTSLQNLQGFVDGVGPYTQGGTHDAGGAESVVIRGERVSYAGGGRIVVLVTNGAGLTRNCDPVFSRLDGALPETTTLLAAYPNPARVADAVVIPFRLAEASPVRLAVYDVLGREVVVLVDGELEAGTYTVVWDGHRDDGQALSSGTYLYRLSGGAVRLQRMLTLLR